MTQRPNGRGPLPAKDVVNLGDLLPQGQYVTALRTLAGAEKICLSGLNVLQTVRQIGGGHDRPHRFETA